MRTIVQIRGLERLPKIIIGKARVQSAQTVGENIDIARMDATGFDITQGDFVENQNNPSTIVSAYPSCSYKDPED